MIKPNITPGAWARGSKSKAFIVVEANEEHRRTYAEKNPVGAPKLVGVIIADFQSNNIPPAQQEANLTAAVALPECLAAMEKMYDRLIQFVGIVRNEVDTDTNTMRLVYSLGPDLEQARQAMRKAGYTL
jgi:hypothetical protein